MTGVARAKSAASLGGGPRRPGPPTAAGLQRAGTQVNDENVYEEDGELLHKIYTLPEKKAPPKPLVAKGPAGLRAPSGPGPRNSTPGATTRGSFMPRGAAAQGYPAAGPGLLDGPPAVLYIRGLAEDVTSREVHILFSACQGYLKADLALEENTGRLQALVYFDQADSAVRAAAARRGTTWSPGGRQVVIEAIGTEAARRLSTTGRAPPIRLSTAVVPRTREETPLSVASGRGNSPGRNGAFDAGDELLQAAPARARGFSPPASSRSQPQSQRSGAPADAPGAPPAGGASLRDTTPRRGPRQESPDSSSPRRRGVSPYTPRTAARSAHVRQIMVKVDAATIRGKVDELEAVLAEAEAAGLDEDELCDAKQVLEDRLTSIARHRAIKAEGRARVKLTEVVKSVIEEERKTAERVHLVESAIRAGLDAGSLCEVAGLAAREKKILAQANQASLQWRQHVTTKVAYYVSKRDVAGLRAVAAECDACGLAESPEHRRLLEAAKRIINPNAVVDEDNEDRPPTPTGLFGQAMTSQRAPQLRALLDQMVKAHTEQWKLDRCRQVLEEAEGKVIARWGLIFAGLSAKSADIFSIPAAMDTLRLAVENGQTSGLQPPDLQEPLAIIKRMDDHRRAAAAYSRALTTKRESAMAEAAQTAAMLTEEQSKAIVQRRLEAAMESNIIYIMKQLPSILEEAQSVGVSPALVEQGRKVLQQARAEHRLEQAMSSKEPWQLRTAIEEARRAGTSVVMISDASQLLEEAECRAEIEFAIQRHDAMGILRGLEAWRRKGFNSEDAESFQASLERVEARCANLRRELDDATAAGVQFEENFAKLAPAGVAMVKAVADILVRYPELAIQVDGHSQLKNESAAKKLSQERADSVKDALVNLGVTNVMITKGWGSTHPEIKKKAVRIYPR